jgi:hypothetical protein
MPETVNPMIGGIGMATSEPTLGDLEPGQTKSLGCDNLIKGVVKASMTIFITYWPGWWPWKLTKLFRFKAVRADDGTWLWKAE